MESITKEDWTWLWSSTNGGRRNFWSDRMV